MPAGEITNRSHVPNDHRPPVNVLRVTQPVVRLVTTEKEFADACQLSGVSTILR